MSESVEDFNEEYKESAKTYLESALKVLGLMQIAAAATDMFWGGFNFNLFNIAIVFTGFVFFLGGEKLGEPLKKLLKKEDKKRFVIDRYDSELMYETNVEQTKSQYMEKQKESDEKKYSFAKREND